MKAIVLTRYGSPDVLQLEDVAKPKPADNEVLVKVRATAVNDWDWCFVRGKPYIYRLMFGLVRPRVTVFGAAVAGTVEATGNGATKFQPEDHVYGDISEAGLGGFAEYVCVREDALSLNAIDLRSLSAFVYFEPHNQGCHSQQPFAAALQPNSPTVTRRADARR